MEKQILEILTSLSRQMDTMNGRMDTMSEQMDTMNGRMDAMSEQMDTMNERMDKMDDKLEAMDTKIDEVHARLDQGFLEIGGLFEVADKRFDVVDQRLLSIEELTKRTAMRDVKYLKHKVSQIEQDVFLLNAND